MGIAVLGPVQVDGQADGLGPRDRVVLSALVVRAGQLVPTEALADALWGDGLPVSWTKVLQGCVMRLRKRLGHAAIVSGVHGYRLDVTDDELDHRVFEGMLARARRSLAAGDPARATSLAREALTLWRGRALPDLEDWAPGRVEATRLEGLRMDAEELWVEAGMSAGQVQEVLERARTLATEAPFRERRWALLARALHQAGRQAEALAVIGRARAMLVEELGLDAGRELVETEVLLLRHDPSLLPPRAPPVSPVCPYRGLLPYGAADAETFFGREDDIAACLRRLRETGALAVVGPSGMGKSSLVRAGVVTSLVRSGTVVLATSPGAHPMASIAALEPGGRQTLVVDQAEEAVTLCADGAERARYFAALAAHAGVGGDLVLALRADHLGDLAPYPDVARIVEHSVYLLGPLTEQGLRRAIEGPARRAGLRLEPGLVDLLVREVEDAPAALPLLSHVLRETWERREGPTLTVAGYHRTGGIRGAVAQSAETLYEALDATQRGQVRGLLLRLVRPNEDGDPVRTRVPRARVSADVAHERLVEQLVEARLVSVDGDTVQIAHESLVRAWPRLRGWLDDDAAGQDLLRHLSGAADAWDAMGRPDSELYRGTRLDHTLEWRDRAGPELDDVESDFLDASSALAVAERTSAEAENARERRANRRLRGAVAGIGVLLVLMLVAGVLAVRAAERAGRDRVRAESAALLADARRAGTQALVQTIAARSLLLGVEAVRVDRSPEEWENLAGTLTRLGSLERIRRTGVTAVVSTAVSGDGGLVALGSPYGGVHLFDAATLAPVGFGDPTPTSAVTFSPDGRLMAAAVNQWTGGAPRIVPQPVRLYELPAGRLAARQPGGWPRGANVEYALAFSRDGRRLVAGVNRYRERGGPGRARVLVWNVRDPARPVLDVDVPDLPQAALSPDGRLLYTATTGPRTVRVYDVDSGRLLRWTGTGLIRQPLKGAVDVSPDGSTLAVATDGRILRFDTATLELRGPPLRGHSAEVTDVEYSHDGSKLLSTSVDRTAVVWDALSGAELDRYAAHGDQIWGGGFGADDQTVYTSSNDELMTWDVSGRSAFLSVGAGGSHVAGNIGVSLAAPDGRTVARIEEDCLWFVDNTTGARTAKASTRREVWDYAWAPDSSRLLTIGPNRMSMWDVESGRVVATRPIPGGGDPRTAFSADGSTLYVDDGTGWLRTLDGTTLRPAGAPVGFVPAATSLLPDPRGGSIVVLEAGGSVARFDLATGAVQASTVVPPGDEDPVGVLAPDGSVLAVSDGEGAVRLLDARTLREVRRTATEAGDALAYAPDGSQLASVQPDRIKLWNGRTGAYEASIPLPNLPATGLWSTATLGPGATIAYLPDSSGVVVASADGRIWSVDTRTESWLDRACRIAGRNLTAAELRQFLPRQRSGPGCPQWPVGG